MELNKIIHFDNKKFIQNKRCTLNGKTYYEFCAADITKPQTIYFDEFVQTVDDDIYLALREKYAPDKKSLHGNFTVVASYNNSHSAINDIRKIPSLRNVTIRSFTMSGDVSFTDYVIRGGDFDGQTLFREGKDNGRKCRHMNSFVYKKANEYLETFYEADIAEFGQNLFEALAKENEPKEIQEELRQEILKRLRGEGIPYSYVDEMEDEAAGTCDGFGMIRFSKIEYAENKFIRAHEMMHRLGNKENRCGILVYGEEHKYSEIFAENGRALNEGITQLLAEKATKQPTDGSYHEYTDLARMLCDAVGEEYVFGGALWSMDALQELENRLNIEAKDGTAYFDLTHTLDNHYANQQRFTDMTVYSNEKRRREQLEPFLIQQKNLIRNSFNIIGQVFINKIQASADKNETKDLINKYLSYNERITGDEPQEQVLNFFRKKYPGFAYTRPQQKMSTANKIKRQVKDMIYTVVLSTLIGAPIGFGVVWLTEGQSMRQTWDNLINPIKSKITEWTGRPATTEQAGQLLEETVHEIEAEKGVIIEDYVGGGPNISPVPIKHSVLIKNNSDEITPKYEIDR